MSEESFPPDGKDELAGLHGEALLKRADESLANAELTRFMARAALDQYQAAEKNAARAHFVVSLSMMLLTFSLLRGC